MNINALKIHFSKTERDSISKEIDSVLDEGKLSQGKYVDRLERSIEKYTGVRYAVAVNSGSSAIEMAMRLLDVKGKTVLLPSNTFLATAAGVIFAGGKVRFVDVNPKTFAIDYEDLKRKYTDDTVGVIIVHIGGIISSEIEKIAAWCDKNNIWLFEDAAHAHGSTFNGKQAGMFGIAASYSLFATKVITSGEGGYLLTNDYSFAEKLRLYRNHGKQIAWKTWHTMFGSNCRMSEITAIIAYHRFLNLKTIIERRHEIANYYTKRLEGNLPGSKIIEPYNGESNWYKYIILLPCNMDKTALKTNIKNKGISLPGEVYEIPLHEQPISDLMNCEEYPLPITQYVCKSHICLPIYEGLTWKEIDYIIETVIIEYKVLLEERCDSN